MVHLIDKAAVVAEIENLENTYKKCPIHNSYEKGLKDGRLIGYEDALYKINTLEVKEVYVSNSQFPYLKDIIDKVFGAGNLEFWEYDDAEQLVLLAKDEVISQVCEAAGIKKPYKDGNQWCILKGENIQEGICGFGDNIEDALVDFLRNIPKIPFEVKEVDLQSEIDRVWDNSSDNFLEDGWKEFEDIAKHFFELGLKAKDWEKERMEECPYRQVGCAMYEGNILECKGTCSWVVDYPKLKELKAQKGEKVC